MSIFIPIPNDKRRVKCTICNNSVSKKLMDRHEQYHLIGEKALSKTETACKYCLTPVSIKAGNYRGHLESFHNISDRDALELNRIAKIEANKRPNQVEKRPRYRLPINIQNQIQIQAEQRAMMNDENKIDQQVVNQFNNRAQNQPQLPKGRPRAIPALEGEDDIARERRLNRQYVQKFRNKIRQQRGLPPPKVYNHNLIEGESKEDREKRLNRERVQAFRERKKAQKQQ